MKVTEHLLLLDELPAEQHELVNDMPAWWNQLDKIVHYRRCQEHDEVFADWQQNLWDCEMDIAGNSVRRS